MLQSSSFFFFPAVFLMLDYRWSTSISLRRMFLSACCTKSLSSSLGVDWGLPSVLPPRLIHWAIHNRAVSFISEQVREQERERKMEVRAFCNLISGATFHHFCHILFIGNKSLGPVHTQWRKLQKDVKASRWRSLGASKKKQKMPYF